MLDTIVEKKKLEVAERKNLRPLKDIVEQTALGNFAFSKAFQGEWGLIAECKLASPVKGRLCKKYSVVELAQIYTANGAAALSVHTDQHFCGKLDDIRSVRQTTSLPILRKDFIIDEYQIYEARCAGADAILLIAAILSMNQLSDYLTIAKNLGMDCLVEVHSQKELEDVHRTPAKLIGINNRDLTSFKTDIKNTFELSSRFDPARLYISESGIKTENDAIKLKEIGIRGILVGEGLVVADDIAVMTRKLAL